jgi:hypothetical protein
MVPLRNRIRDEMITSISMEISEPPQGDFWQDDRPLSGKSLGKTLTQPQAILWDTPRIASYLTVKESMIRCW